jgi:ribosomal protein S12
MLNEVVSKVSAYRLENGAVVDENYEVTVKNARVGDLVFPDDVRFSVGGLEFTARATDLHTAIENAVNQNFDEEDEDFEEEDAE